VSLIVKHCAALDLALDHLGELASKIKIPKASLLSLFEMNFKRY